MDRFLELKRPKVSSKHGVIFGSFMAQEFGLSFYESGGKLFGKSGNLVIHIVHHRKFAVKRHIDNLLFIGINLNQRHRCNCSFMLKH